MNKYHQILSRILEKGTTYSHRKGDIIALINEQLTLTPSEMIVVK